MSGAAMLCALLAAHSFPVWFAVWFAVRTLFRARTGKGGAA